MKIPALKAVSVLLANKTALIAVGASLAVAVPTTIYLSSTNRETNTAGKTTPESTQNGSNPKVKSAQSKSNTSSTASTARPGTSLNPATAKVSNNTTSSQTPTSSTGGTTNNNNSSSNTTTTLPPIDDWYDHIDSSSPTDCGAETNKCTVGQEVVESASFWASSDRPVHITKCDASGFQGAGPKTDNPYKPATATITSNNTCTVHFTAPNYGQFGVWVDVYTDASPTYPYKGFNLKGYWFQ